MAGPRSFAAQHERRSGAGGGGAGERRDRVGHHKHDGHEQPEREQRDGRFRYHALLQRGESPARLKAFTLAVDGGGRDLEQAREFLRRLGLELFLEAIQGRPRGSAGR